MLRLLPFLFIVLASPQLAFSQPPAPEIFWPTGEEDPHKAAIRKLTLYVNFDPDYAMDRAWQKSLERDWVQSWDANIQKTVAYDRASEHGRYLLTKSALFTDIRVAMLKRDITVIVMQDVGFPSPAVIENSVYGKWTLLPRYDLPMPRFWVEYIAWWHSDYMREQIMEEYCEQMENEDCERADAVRELMWQYARDWCEKNGAWEVYWETWGGGSRLRHKDYTEIEVYEPYNGMFMDFKPVEHGFTPPPAVAWKPKKFPENPTGWMMVRGGEDLD